MPTALLGLALHCVIAPGAAAVYFVLCLRIPALLKKPFVYGPVFGLGVYFVMSFVIVPLSRTPKQPPAGPMQVLHELLAHTLLVGVPVALMATRSARSHHQ